MPKKYRIEYAIGSRRNPVRFARKADNAVACEEIVARLLEGRCVPRSIKRGGRVLSRRKTEEILKQAKTILTERHLQSLGLSKCAV